MGLVNFLRRFIPNLSEQLKPLIDMTKDGPFKWSDRAIESFKMVKNLFSDPAILAHPNQDHPFILECDASDFAFGAQLLQEGGDGIARPVSYYSAKMSGPQLNYPIYDKEMLAIVESLCHWQYLLAGTLAPITIRTNHKALEYFKSPQKLNSRQSRWMQDLSLFNFKIEYKAGKLNYIPDMLSRNPKFKPTKEELVKLNTHTLLPASSFCIIYSQVT